MTAIANIDMNNLTEAQDMKYFDFCEKHDLDVMLSLEDQIQFLRDVDKASLALKLQSAVLRDEINAARKDAKLKTTTGKPADSNVVAFPTVKPQSVEMPTSVIRPILNDPNREVEDDTPYEVDALLEGDSGGKVVGDIDDGMPIEVEEEDQLAFSF